jgi:flavin-dependent dehydrogenase
LVAHPRFQDRFANAQRIGPVKGWGLPLGSKPRPMAGDGWLLVGDAASLIDPFTGEGIGNAMIGGLKAAEWAARAQAAGDYSAHFLHGFEQEVMDRLRNELHLSHMMQRLSFWKWLLNAVIRKASRS